jgi:hypothetical protein
MVPHLPNEIHHAIVKHLGNRNLANYRLVSHTLANIGAEELFRTLKFHASRRSTNRIRAAAAHERYRGYVKAMIWDSNMWDIRVWVPSFKEMEEVVCKKHPENPYVNPAYFKRYQRRRREEESLSKSLLNFDNLKGLLRRFPDLQKIYVMNGDFSSDHRRIKKYSALPPAPKTGQIMVRGISMYNYDFSGDFVGKSAFTNFAKAAPSTLTRLRIDALDYQFFATPNYLRDIEKTVSNITNLRLRITCLKEDAGSLVKMTKECWATLRTTHNLKTLLKAMPKLQSLTLNFEERVEEKGNGTAYINYCVSWGYVWPLRKLSLSNLDTSTRRIVKLIKDHSATLRDLRLCNIYLNTKGSWIEVLVTLRPDLELESATVKGCLASIEGPEEYGCDIDGELGKDVAAYLVRGGDCPLMLDNTRMAIRKRTEEAQKRLLDM